MRRRIRVLVAAPLVVVLLVLAGKTLGMSAVAARGLVDYTGARYAASASWFSRLGLVNVLEPYVAPFDRGDARYAQHDFAGAARDLTAALRLAPGGRRCAVRVNLELSRERLGDAAVGAKDLPLAERAYHQALATTSAGCVDGPGTQLTAARARLRAKISAIEQRHTSGPRRGSGRHPSTSTPAPNQADRLEQRNLQAARREQAARDGARLGRHVNGQPNPRPW